MIICSCSFPKHKAGEISHKFFKLCFSPGFGLVMICARRHSIVTVSPSRCLFENFRDRFYMFWPQVSYYCIADLICSGCCVLDGHFDCRVHLFLHNGAVKFFIFGTSMGSVQAFMFTDPMYCSLILPCRSPSLPWKLWAILCSVLLFSVLDLVGSIMFLTSDHVLAFPSVPLRQSQN